MRVPFLAALALLLPFAAHAADSPIQFVPAQDWLVQQSAECDAAISAAETKYNIPHGILGSIAKVESGRPISSLHDIRAWPWTINADGRGLFLDSKAAAIAWVRQAQASGSHYIDVGCMQVDLPLHPGAFRSLDDAFDPAINADYAARLLTTLNAEARGDWNVAVGLYHSHTPELAADYRNRVAAVGAGIITGIGGPEPLYQKALRAGTLRLALAGGGSLIINVRRQPARRPQHVSRCQVALALRGLLARPLRGCS